MPGPYRGAMGKWEMEVGRRGEDTPPYARILSGAVGRPALWPPWSLAAAGSGPVGVGHARPAAFP